MTAVQVTESPRIDGKLDDPIWDQAVFSGGFIQREPVEGEPATEDTEVAILYDDKNLYIAARCFDSEPGRIIATEMRRDEHLWNDDNFEVIIDTFNDKRNAFFFTTNPLAMRRDGKVSDEGRVENSDWDGVWLCKTSRDDRGWFAEMAIPWQTLRFKEGDNITWGINFVRKIQRKNEDDYWKLIPRYAGRSGRFRMSEAGRISGFSGLKMGGKYELKPFVRGGIQKDSENELKTERLGDTGIDLKMNLTGNITADFTYNTDFAQVEADQERVNLTRFSMFFPEKREFFLEGAETFRFGNTGSRMPWRMTSDKIQLFYSRRIGLESRQLVPVIGGARLNGKVGKYTMGMMSISTENTTIEDDDEIETVPQTNFSAFRIKRELFSRSSVGMMVLNKDETGGGYNRSVGLDSHFPLNENFTVFAAGAATYSPDEEGEPSFKSNNFAGNIGFTWISDLWEYSASFLDIEEQFNPEMGFVRRTDIKLTEAKFAYKPRPKRFEAVRQIEFANTFQYQTDHNNKVLNRKFEGEYDVSFENTMRYSIDVTLEEEFLDEEWEVREGYIVPVGTYNNTEYRSRLSSNRSYAVHGNISGRFGEYFTGTKKGFQAEINLKAFSRLIGELNYNYDIIKMPEGKFHTATVTSRLSYTFSPDMFVKAFLQWYDDKLLNDGKNLFSANVIFRYIYRPGSDLFLVYNQENLLGGTGNDILQNRTIIAKLNYFFRR